MNSPWMKLAVSLLMIIAALLAALIINALFPPSTEQGGDVSSIPLWLVVGLLYPPVVWLAAREHSTSRRLTKLEAADVAAKAQYRARGLWRVEDIFFGGDEENNRFIVLTLRHLSWSENFSLIIRNWHPEFYESSMLKEGMIIGFEAVSDPLNRAEKMELASYLHIKV